MTSKRAVRTTDGAASLTVGEPARRLRALVAEHDKLLVAIERKRRELARFEQKIRDATDRVESHVAPIAEQLRELDDQIHSTLAALIADKRRSDKARKQIRRVRLDLERAGIISSRDLGEDEPAPPDWVEADLPSAPKQTDAGALRTLFRALADALHPDKVQDETEKASRTEVMKQITVAYSQGDYARLVEIQRTWAASAPLAGAAHGDDIARRHRQLVEANQSLGRQLRALTLALRRLRASDDGQLARAVHRGEEVEDLVGPIDEQLDALRRLAHFVEAFRAGQISLSTFLAGPTPPQDDEEADDLFSAVESAMQDMMTEMDELLHPRRKRRRST